MNNYNLLVHYSSEKGYFSARKEIEKTLISLGDKKPIIDKLTSLMELKLKKRSLNQKGYKFCLL